MTIAVRESTLKALEGKSLTRCIGRPTYESVDETRREIATEYAKAKTTHADFPLGKRFGFAAAVLKVADYRRIHNTVEQDANRQLDAQWTFTNPTRPTTYDTAITGAMLEATRRQREAKRAELITQWEIFDAHETKYKDLIEEAYDATYLKSIKDDFLGFSHKTARDMLDHLETQCLALTTSEKQAKLKDLVPSWNLDDDTEVFFSELEDCEDNLKKLQIEWPTSHKINHAVSELCASGLFSEDDLMDWEDKPEADKTWVHCQTYFNKIFKKRKRFGNLKPKTHGYESAANMDEARTNEREELHQHLRDIAEAATADKEHLQQMSGTTEELLTIIKKQQTQIEELLQTTKSLTQSIAKLSNTKTPPTTTNANKNNNNNSKGCALCGKHRNTKDCFELESNKAKRPEGWTSTLT